jgi:integrase
VFLFSHVLKRPLGEIGEFPSAKRPQRIPTVLDRDDVGALLAKLDGTAGLIARLLYGSGLRLGEGLGLRVKDLDLPHRQLVVRNGKGAKDRVTVVASCSVDALRAQIDKALERHRRELSHGRGEAWIWPSLERKYPGIARQPGWQFVFPASGLWQDPDSGRLLQLHVHESVVQKAIRAAAVAADITKPVSCHTLRHCFATHLLYCVAFLPSATQRQKALQSAILYQSENSWRTPQEPPTCPPAGPGAHRQTARYLGSDLLPLGTQPDGSEELEHAAGSRVPRVLPGRPGRQPRSTPGLG